MRIHDWAQVSLDDEGLKDCTYQVLLGIETSGNMFRVIRIVPICEIRDNIVTNNNHPGALLFSDWKEDVEGARCSSDPIVASALSKKRSSTEEQPSYLWISQTFSLGDDDAREYFLETLAKANQKATNGDYYTLYRRGNTVRVVRLPS